MSLLTNYNSHVIWTEKPLGNWAVSNSPGGSPGAKYESHIRTTIAKRLVVDSLPVLC
jgi:hypothetical protein